MAKCMWCGEELHFVTGKGWLHPDGNLYKQKPDPKRPGQMIDDHCALPDYSGERMSIKRRRG